MAYIRERRTAKGLSRYTATVEVKGHDPVSQTFGRMTDAKEWAKQTEYELKRGIYIKEAEAKKHTLKDLIDRYIEKELPHKKTDPKKVTMQLNWWKDKIGAKLLSDITPKLLSEYKDILISESSPKAQKGRETRTKATANRYLAALSVVLTKAANEWEWIDSNPMSKVSKFQEPKGRTRFLNDRETKNLLGACEEASNPMLYIFVSIALATGARWGEIINLTWDNVDFKNKMFYFMNTKNTDHRGVPISSHVLKLLKDHKKSAKVHFKWVFPKEDGTQPIDLRWQWERALEASGIEDFRFHDLRHTTASNLAKNGCSLLAIGTILGHKTVSMTKRYAHLTTDHTAELLERMNANQFKNIEAYKG